MSNRDGRRGQRGRSGSGGSRSSGVLDGLTSVDDLLRSLNASVDALNQTVNSLASSIDSQTGLEVDVTQQPRGERAYDLSTVVPADTPTNQPLVEEFSIPSAGTVSKVLIGWPDGAQQAVGVGVKGTDFESLVPAGPSDARYVALNDKVLTFDLNDDVAKDDTYTIEYANADTTNDHFVNVIVFLLEDSNAR